MSYNHFPNNVEFYAVVTMHKSRRQMIQYGYKNDNGKVFFCLKPTLEDCRNARYHWAKFNK